MLMCFQPVIRLQGNDKHAQVQNIFFQYHQLIGAETFH